ncbi:MAG TPA: DJ-1/PfpI family protein [Candidatus Krumholzibacteria bacterium]|nr:DJ-1/PfpI family protein [Candidatus Krumholzibacteria bacterium]HPD72644.1 DJ-1/PfpI family protein [Candidatus Krumholzibacteria bacterium]HRY40424.1 DJ-1/PfpI family protein [Candidatus Krumholzibacteria bacterium]
MSTLTALVPVADGTEEIEAVTVVDTLRRAGITVTVAAVGADLAVTCSRGVRLVADRLLDDLAGQTFDLIALPGGLPGAAHLRDSPALTALLRGQHARGALIGAICAAPVVVLLHHGLLDGRAATCFPALADRLPAGQLRRDPVVVDGSLVTSRGPGTALEFALALVEQLAGASVRARVAGPLLAAD